MDPKLKGLMARRLAVMNEIDDDSGYNQDPWATQSVNRIKYGPDDATQTPPKSKVRGGKTLVAAAHTPVHSPANHAAESPFSSQSYNSSPQTVDAQGDHKSCAWFLYQEVSK